MFKFIVIGFASLALLAGCAGDQSKGPTYPVVGTVDQKQMEQAAFVARSAYAGVLRWMVEYVSEPRCGTTSAQGLSPPFCSSQSVVNEMRKVELAADAATKGASDLARAPTKSPVALANAVADAQRAVEIFRSVVAVYKPQAKEAQ